MNNHSINRVTLEISAYAFVCYPCFTIMKRKKINKKYQSVLAVERSTIIMTMINYLDQSDEISNKLG